MTGEYPSIEEAEVAAGQVGVPREFATAAEAAEEFQVAEMAAGQVGVPMEFAAAEAAPVAPLVPSPVPSPVAPRGLRRVVLPPRLAMVAPPMPELAPWWQSPWAILAGVSLFLGGLYVVTTMARK